MIFASNQRWSGKISHETWWLTRAGKGGGGKRIRDDFRNPKVVRSPVTYRVCNLLPFPGRCEKYQRCINLTFNPLLKSQHPWSSSTENRVWTIHEPLWNRVYAQVASLFQQRKEGLYLCQWCGFLIFERLFPREMNRFIK